MTCVVDPLHTMLREASRLASFNHGRKIDEIVIIIMMSREYIGLFFLG